MSIMADLFVLLSTDAGITAQLATYESAAAVFSGSVPRDATCPYVLLVEAGTSGESQNRCARGFQQLFDLWIIDDRTGSMESARDIAHLIWDAVDREPYSDSHMAGWFETLGIRQISDSDQFPGMGMTVVARAWEV